MTHASLKLQGPWEVRRKFKVAGLSHAADARKVEQALFGIAGVRALSVDLSRRLVRVRYETTETDCQTIRNALETAGFPLADGWWTRRKYQWLQNLDLTGRENAGVKPSPCCNKPPGAKH